MTTQNSGLSVVQLQPKQTPPPAIDFHELMDVVCNKHGYDFRDMASSHGHFYKWCDARGLGQTDPDGKHRGASQIWFAEYKAAPDGEVTCPPYHDVWHWLLDGPFEDLDRGGITEFAIDDWIVEAADAGEDDYYYTPDYCMRVLRDMKAEAEGHPGYVNGVMYLFIDW